MTRTILFTTALASAIGLGVLGANAQQQAAPAQSQERMSIAQIATKLEAQGYEIVEIELEHGRYDVEMIDAKGMRVEAYLNPVNGEVLPYREDDGHGRDKLDD